MIKIFLFIIAAALVLTADAGNRLKEQLSTPEHCLTVYRNPEADSVLRRAAFRKLLESPRGEAILQSGLKDADPAIRSWSVFRLFQQKGDGAYDLLKGSMRESDPQTASLLLACAQRFKDKLKSRELITLLSKQSQVREVRRAAVRIIDFPYYRKVMLLRDNPTHDHEVVTVRSVPLAQTGWKFRPDPLEDGHHKGWFKPDFKDAKWKEISLTVWEKQGYEGYDGIAWYRLRFKMPPKTECKAVEIHFDAVDESAWVWLNGKYVGQHDVGPSGWNQPFDLDITREIQWGGENLLTVRVEDTMAAGGIWKPVKINIVK